MIRRIRPVSAYVLFVQVESVEGEERNDVGEATHIAAGVRREWNSLIV